MNTVTSSSPFSQAHETLPSEAFQGLALLEDGDYEAWFVGGMVRDLLLGRPIHDIDITTNAPWQEVVTIFSHAGWQCIETGTAHGTVTVLANGIPLEITTYRVDGAYHDGRHPDSVQFTQSITEDLARRAFTINAMAWHPARGLCDPFDGQQDLAAQIIRCVGNPATRFDEDGLRILRALRFAAQLDFSLDPLTAQAALEGKSRLQNVSAERQQSELQKLILGPQAGSVLVAYVDTLAYALPELIAMKDCPQQTPYHCYDVLEHSARALDAIPPTATLRWAALFHDVGKPATRFRGADGVDHFYGHDALGATLAHQAMTRLKFPRKLQQRVELLIRHHNNPIEPTPRAVRRCLRRLEGNTEAFRELCLLKKADGLAHAPGFQGEAVHYESLLTLLDSMIAEEEALSVKDLAINGRDLIALGMTPGPALGDLLEQLFTLVCEEKVANTNEDLTEMACSLMEKSA